MTENDRFLTRWSRRKQAARVELPPEPASEPPASAEGADLSEERTDDEILAELELPHPDDLKPGDDVKGFMQAAVPARLRRMALRQLWQSDPALSIVDGLLDYSEDYTDAAMVVDNLQTAYQVGRGFWTDEDELKAAEAEAEAEAAAGKELDEINEEPSTGAQTTSTDVNTPQDSSEIVEQTATDETDATDAEQPRVAPTHRRMVFHYDS